MHQDFIYFGVDCRKCDARIPLIEVVSAPHIHTWNLPPIDIFIVACQHCGATARYRQRNLVIVLLDSPAETFVPHEQFERLRF